MDKEVSLLTRIFHTPCEICGLIAGTAHDADIAGAGRVPRWLRIAGFCLAALAGVFLFAAAFGPCRWRADAGQRRIEQNRGIVIATARRLELPVGLFLAAAAAESAFDDRARSHKGAIGLMQVMPATAWEVTKEFNLGSCDLTDPRDNALIGGLYLKKMIRRYRGDYHLALAAYNAGPSAVDNWISKGDGLPGPEVVAEFGYDETRAYVATVLKNADSIAWDLEPEL